jgi:hypothetical protein
MFNSQEGPINKLFEIQKNLNEKFTKLENEIKILSLLIANIQTGSTETCPLLTNITKGESNGINIQGNIKLTPTDGIHIIEDSVNTTLTTVDNQIIFKDDNESYNTVLPRGLKFYVISDTLYIRMPGETGSTKDISILFGPPPA